MFRYAEFILQLRLFKIAIDDVDQGSDDSDDVTEHICNDPGVAVPLLYHHHISIYSSRPTSQISNTLFSRATNNKLCVHMKF